MYAYKIAQLYMWEQEAYYLHDLNNKQAESSLKVSELGSVENSKA